MIETDVSEIKTTSRTYIKAQEWNVDESRTYYFRGYEKVTKWSENKQKDYTVYYIYLWKTVGEVIGGEETLSVFASSAQSLKTSGVKQFQELTVTKKVDDKGYEVWDFVAGDKTIPVKERPTPEDYPEIGEPVRTKTVNPDEEVDIDSIPF